MIKHILLPLDGSEHALKAFDLACDLSNKYTAKLTLFHVIEDMRVPEALHHFAEIEHLPDDGYTLHYKVIAEGIINNAKLLATQKGVTQLHSLIVEGNAAQQILQHAQTLGVDTIIMGSRGLGRFEGLLQGSVSQRVNHLAKCTCITVK